MVAARICGCTPRSAAIACEGVCPGLRLTIMLSHEELTDANWLSSPRISGSAANGSMTSVIRPTSIPKNPGGSTPTMVNTLRCSVIWRPITSSAPPNCSRQNRWLITATGPSGALGASSAGVSTRPRTADRPSTSKKRPLTCAPSTNALCPPRDRSKLSFAHAKAPSNRSFSRALISAQTG